MFYRRLTALGLATALAVPAVAAAQGYATSTSAFSYTYGEVNLDYLDPDHSPDDSGLNIRGSAELIPHGFVTAGYTRHSFGRVDSNLFSVGLGYHIPVAQMGRPTDLVISGAFNHNNLSHRSDDNYGTLSVGLRTKIAEQVELHGGVKAFFAEDAFNRNIGADVGVRFYPVHQLSVGMSAEVSDNTFGMRFGGRFEF